MRLFYAVTLALSITLCASMFFLCYRIYRINRELTALKTQLCTIQIMTSVDYADKAGLPDFEKVKKPSKRLKQKSS